MWEKPISWAVKEFRYYTILILDKRISKVPRYLLTAAMVYLLSPLDLIPDFIPIIGKLDDLIIVSILTVIANRFISKDIKKEAREKVNEDISNGW
jgi:uncharacterized membrane protein YkvA (DUF1232 family)